MIRVISFVAIMFLFSGLLILLVDRKIYKTGQKKKEAKAASFLGWMNLACALLLFGAFLWLH
ncbi:CLC_0170 family protein [Fontibacillus sp. BL9]|uniref:CLC_0170 family protein n=1 Tax=Fontibacillus sp. BL9 TaxID=3389971 RepID=UPI00397A4D54